MLWYLAGKLDEQKGQQQKQDSFHLTQNFVPGDIPCQEENHA